MKLGIDIGGTKIRAILLDGKNKPVVIFNIPTPNNKKSFLESLEIEINKIIQNYKISGIGVGLPGIVDKNKGTLIKAPHISFLKNWHAKKFFYKFSKNIKIENDSRCFVLAEAEFGEGRGLKNIVGITIGTGIGGGIIIGGKVYRGKNNSAGEFGHIIINNQKTFEQLGAKEAFFKYGDRSEIIGIGIANLINVLNPDIVILGGGGIISGKIKTEIVRKTAKKYIMSPLAKNTLIVKGKLGENSPAIGAALSLKQQ